MVYEWICLVCMFHTLRKKCPYSKFFWSVFFRIQSECGKIQTRKTPNTDTFRAVRIAWNNVVLLYEVIFRALSNSYDEAFLRK